MDVDNLQFARISMSGSEALLNYVDNVLRPLNETELCSRFLGNRRARLLCASRARHRASSRSPALQTTRASNLETQQTYEKRRGHPVSYVTIPGTYLSMALWVS